MEEEKRLHTPKVLLLARPISEVVSCGSRRAEGVTKLGGNLLFADEVLGRLHFVAEWSGPREKSITKVNTTHAASR